MSLLNIYSDQKYLNSNSFHTPILYPFWKVATNAPQKHTIVFDKYIAFGRDFFKLVSLQEADYIIAPTPWENNDEQILTHELAEHATPEKPIIVFFWHDSTEPVDLPNSVVFRTSFYKSTQKPNEFALPAWNEDFIDDNLVLREKQEKPVVGFCGYAITHRNNLIQYAKDAVRLFKDGLAKTREKHQRRSYHVMRGNMLRLLKNDPNIHTNFIIRDKFFGHANDPVKAQHEYIENTLNSDYVLCLRGAGNFSYRLYETLSCGRIPVFVNTDCVLPYDFLIDWKQYCVWIDISEINQIADKVVEFHANLSPQDFIDLQKKCRQLWEDYLSPQGFFKNFYRHFE